MNDKAKKIYLVIEEDVLDDSTPSRTITAFQKMNSAIDFFLSLKEQRKENDDLRNISDLAYEDSETCFSYYEDGYWVSNHYDVSIEEVLIED